MINSRKRSDLREQLSEQQYEIWRHRMVDLFSLCIENPDGSYTVPPEEVMRWRQHINWSYSALSEEDKHRNQEQVDQILTILDANAREQDGPEIDPEQVKDYRKHLVEARQKAQEDFDKTVLSLSGGALGISFAFVKDIAGPGQAMSPYWLVTAWFCWAASSAFILVSYFMSHVALDRSIESIDKGEFAYRPGGIAAVLTYGLNILAGCCFILGVVAIGIFVFLNLR